MIQLQTNTETGSFVVWPESGSNSSGSYRLQVTHSMNLATNRFDVYRINTPNNLSEYLVLQAYSGSIPTASGQYVYNLEERLTEDYTFASASFTFAQADGTWGGGITPTAGDLIDSGRLFVSGTNDASFTSYTTDNETGRYTTYYN